MMTREEALETFRNPDLIGIGMAADALRRSCIPSALYLHYR